MSLMLGTNKPPCIRLLSGSSKSTTRGLSRSCNGQSSRELMPQQNGALQSSAGECPGALCGGEAATWVVSRSSVALVKGHALWSAGEGYYCNHTHPPGFLLLLLLR